VEPTCHRGERYDTGMCGNLRSNRPRVGLVFVLFIFFLLFIYFENSFFFLILNVSYLYIYVLKYSKNYNKKLNHWLQ
jgi:O-antigen ligase